MKRLGIFAFYDKNGFVSEYINFLLNDLVSLLNKLVIVVNGFVDNEGYKVFCQYADEVVIRNNVGYDAGAYKEVIIAHIGSEALKDYSQIVLLNDTFYGPLWPFREIFQDMNRPSVDFWGINFMNNLVGDHIQSYFLVFNDAIIKEDALFDFFSELKFDEKSTISDICTCFEIGLFQYLTQRGFSFDTYSIKNHSDIYTSSNYCIKKYRIPLMKKKCFMQPFYKKENVIDALKYICNSLNYDINMILQDAQRNYNFTYKKTEILNFPDMFSIDYQLNYAKEKNEIEKFLSEYSNIYIYGIGMIAKKLILLYSTYFQNVKGFFVSDSQIIYQREIMNFDVLHLSDINPNGVAVLVALNLENTRAVLEDLKQFNNIFVLWKM